MKYKISAYNIWELGMRSNQEDSIFPEFGKIQDTDRLFIVCDGMGGHSNGEVASKTVCEALSRSILERCPDAEGSFTDEDFKAALSDTFDALDAKDNGAEKKMGTTLTFLKLHDKGCTIAHIGDSRVYHVRPGKTPQETVILFQTYDHSLVNDLIKIGEITPEEAKLSKQKNVITRAMQPCMERRPKADIYHTHDIKPGDYFLMCSDGILEQMEDENIKYIFSDKVSDPQSKVEMLIKVTSQNHDNHSAVLVRVNEVIDPIPVVAAPTPKQPELLMAEVSEDSVPAINEQPIKNAPNQVHNPNITNIPPVPIPAEKPQIQVTPKPKKYYGIMLISALAAIVLITLGVFFFAGNNPVKEYNKLITELKESIEKKDVEGAKETLARIEKIQEELKEASDKADKKEIKDLNDALKKLKVEYNKLNTAGNDKKPDDKKSGGNKQGNGNNSGDNKPDDGKVTEKLKKYETKITEFESLVSKKDTVNAKKTFNEIGKIKNELADNNSKRKKDLDTRLEEANKKYKKLLEESKQSQQEKTEEAATNPNKEDKTDGNKQEESETNTNDSSNKPSADDKTQTDSKPNGNEFNDSISKK